MTWLASLLGGGVGAVVAGLIGAIAAGTYRRQRDDAHAQASMLRRCLDEQRRAAAAAADEAAIQFAQARSREIDERERSAAVVRFLRSELERYRSLLDDASTPASVAARLDEFGRLRGGEPASSDAAGSADGRPVPGRASAATPPLPHRKG